MSDEAAPPVPQHDETDWYGPEVATFGDRVAAARESAGMSQSALARRLGVRVGTLRRWENDISEPRANRLSMLAGLLNVSMMWLINGEGEGLDVPEAALPLSRDDAALLAELASLRRDMLQGAKKLAELEGRLRSSLKGTPND